jgi:hypothetical protein
MTQIRKQQVAAIRAADAAVRRAFTSRDPAGHQYREACRKLDQVLRKSTDEEAAAARGRGSGR